MDLSISHEGEMAVPLNSSYGHGHMIHPHRDHPAASLPHDRIISSSAPQIPSNINNGPSMTASMEDNHVPHSKKTVRYRECLKNHAAAMGGNATDGCGEFMPSGEEGSIEALTCLACNCHRNFHRKEIQGETSSSSCDCCHINNRPHFDRVGRKIILSHHKSILTSEALGYPTGTTAGTLVPSRAAAPPHQYPMMMSYNMGSLPSESEDHEYGGGVVVARPPPQLAKKRFRTKFTQEQKEKMLDFAEKVGWKMQRQGEAVVQQFCQEIGVKRRVLKVWMHNNKHSLAKKSSTTTTTSTA